MKKCPVCDYAIEGPGVVVTVEGKKHTVCCTECAEKLKKKSKPTKA